MSCGGPGEPCCNGAACDNDLTCSAGTCTGFRRWIGVMWSSNDEGAGYELPDGGIGRGGSRAAVCGAIAASETRTR